MKNNIGYIKDILEHIIHIENFLFNVTEGEFYKNKEKEFSVIRSFEVIGEAPRKVGDNLKEKNKDIPWKKMAGFRDILIHDYDRLVAEVVWKTAKEQLPILKPRLL